MADVADTPQTTVTFPRTVQYQEIASVPSPVQFFAPDFFAAYAPSYFPPRYPEHPQPFAPPVFTTLPADVMNDAAYYPDRLERARALGEYPQPVMNIDPIPPPAPDFGQRAVFPDRLERQRGLWPMPWQGEMNYDPIANPTVPDSGNRAFFPDRLVRALALTEYPQPAMNLEPLPGATAPTFFKANFQDRMLRYPPPFQPPFHYTPTPEVFLTLDGSSRGLYQGPRGLYENLESAHCEPYAIARSTGQIISSGSVTEVDLNSVPFSTGFFAGTDADPWGLVNLTTDRIIIKHAGYYIISAVGEWESDSTGLRQVEISWTGGGTGGQILRLTYLASNFSGFSAVSTLFPMNPGKEIRVRVQQQSGGPLELLNLYLSIVRVSRPAFVLPI